MKLDSKLKVDQVEEDLWPTHLLFRRSLKSKNMSVVAAMNKNKMLFCKIYVVPIGTTSFQECLNDLLHKCEEANLINPVLVLDNIAFHHSEDLDFTGYETLYLPPYSPFLNIIENAFLKWKNYVNVLMQIAEQTFMI